ncbi:unnamed protein product [Trichobilharzia szidati]|nr:unnamed protein product [Trichobilharzia szidati]
MPSSHRVKDCLKSITNEEIMVYRFRAYVSPLLALIGIPTNILVIIIFIIIDKRGSCRFNHYAIWLAFSHLAQHIINTLIDDFLGRGLLWATGCRIWYQVDAYSSFTCKALTYLSDVFALISSFILMLFSIDRVCSIYNPKRCEQTLHLGVAKLCIPIIYIVCLLLNIPHIINADLKYTSNRELSCEYVDPVANGVKYVLYLYIIGGTLLPALLIFITNILISCKLKSAIRRSKSIGFRDKDSHSELSKVITHLAISIMFTCLSIPLVILVILRQEVHFKNYEIIYPKYAHKIIQLSKLFSSLESFNHTFEFFFYWAFLPVFRRTLYQMLSSCYSSLLCNAKKTHDKETRDMKVMNSTYNIISNNHNHNNNNEFANNNQKINVYNHLHSLYHSSELGNYYTSSYFPIGYSPLRQYKGCQHLHHQRHPSLRYNYHYYAPGERKQHELYCQLEYSKPLSFYCIDDILHKNSVHDNKMNQRKLSKDSNFMMVSNL